MRHRVKTPKLGRTMEHRKAMLKNLATSILLKGLQDEQLHRQVVTTLQKAKAVRRLVERLITYGKKGDLSAKRLAIKHVKDKTAFQGLFDVLAERYKNRVGGYTRILKLSSNRHGDNAEMAIITLVEDVVTPKPKKKKKTALKKKSSVAEKSETRAENAVEVAEAVDVKDTELSSAAGSESVSEEEVKKPAAAEKSDPDSKKDEPAS